MNKYNEMDEKKMQIIFEFFRKIKNNFPIRAKKKLCKNS